MWPPPDGGAAPHSLRVGPPAPCLPPSPLPPVSTPTGRPPWPGNAAACAARAERAAAAHAATARLTALLGPAASSALGVSRIGAADGADWSVEEVRAFAAAVGGARGRGDFRHVAASLPGRRKSVARCVSFYYNVWKLMLVPEAVAHYDCRAAERAERGAHAHRTQQPPKPRAAGGAATAARQAQDPALRYDEAERLLAARRGGRPPPPRFADDAAGNRATAMLPQQQRPGAAHPYGAAPGFAPAGAPAHPVPSRSNAASGADLRAAAAAAERGIGPLRGPLGGKRGLTGKSRSGLRKPKVLSGPQFAAARKAAGAAASQPAPQPAPRPAQPVATRVGYAGYNQRFNPAVAAAAAYLAASRPGSAAPRANARPAAARSAALTAAFAADFGGGGGSYREDDGDASLERRRAQERERKRRRLADAAAFDAGDGDFDAFDSPSAAMGTGRGSDKKARVIRGNTLSASVNNRARVHADTAAALMAQEAAPVVTSKARAVAAAVDSAAIITPTATSDIVAHALAKAADKSMAITFDPKHSGTLVNPVTGRVYPRVPGTITSTPSSRGGVGGKFDAETTRLLAAAFELNPFPNRATKIALAAQTGLTPEQTRVWFMNARYACVGLRALTTREADAF